MTVRGIITVRTKDWAEGSSALGFSICMTKLKTTQLSFPITQILLSLYTYFSFLRIYQELDGY